MVERSDTTGKRSMTYFDPGGVAEQRFCDPSRVEFIEFAKPVVSLRSTTGYSL